MSDVQVDGVQIVLRCGYSRSKCSTRVQVGAVHLMSHFVIGSLRDQQEPFRVAVDRRGVLEYCSERSGMAGNLPRLGGKARDIRNAGKRRRSKGISEILLEVPDGIEHVHF